MHDAGRGIEGCCSWRQPPWSVGVVGEAKCIQGSNRCTVVAVRRGCRRRESQGVVVMERKVREVGRDKGVR